MLGAHPVERDAGLARRLPPRSEIEAAGGLLVGGSGEQIELVAGEPIGLYPELLVLRAEAAGAGGFATVTVPYTDELVTAWGIEEARDVGIASRMADGTWHWSPAMIDAAANTATAAADGGVAWAAAPSWMVRPWQQRQIAGAAFAPGERNALVVHGWNDEPWSGCMLGLAAGIAPAYDNVASVAYPSALDMRETAVWLRAEIEARWRDTPFDIIAFSEGGLVARATIEPHAWNGGRGLEAAVGRLVTIGTPHGGLRGGAALSYLDDEAGRQMRAGSEFLRELNDQSAPGAREYVAIAGDLGDGHDNVVDVESALGRGLFPATVRAVVNLPHSPRDAGARGMPCHEDVYALIAGEPSAEDAP